MYIIAGGSIMIRPLSHEKESFIPTKLITDLRNGHVMAWVGAGLSIGAGYPSWTDLVNAIANKVDSTIWAASELHEWSHKNANISPEWVAEVLCSANKREYYEAIKDEFNIIRNNESIPHALLALLPFRGYITTNFDTLIENNIKIFTSYRPAVFNNNLNAIDLLTSHKDEKFVYKIHGDINSSVENIVLKESDFFSLQRNEVFNKIMSWVFSNHTVICLGYSLRDRDFRAILEERYQLFRGNCPPLYVFASAKETCVEEINCYKTKYNLDIVPINPEYGFEELSSTLLKSLLFTSSSGVRI